MALIRRIAGFAFVAMLVGCKDAAAPLPVDDPGEFKAKWAGTDWVGGAIGLVNKGDNGADTLFVFTSRSTGIKDVEQGIVVAVPLHGLGVYNLGADQASFSEIMQGDIESLWYRTTPEATGTLVLTRYDGIGGQVEGTISFDAVPYPRSAARFGTQATLEDGRFRASVSEYGVRQLPATNWWRRSF